MRGGDMKEDQFTNTPEDAAKYEAVRYQAVYDCWEPTLADLYEVPDDDVPDEPHQLLQPYEVIDNESPA
jgi:hypothetical protein